MGHVANMGENRSKYWVFVRESEGKRPLVRPKHRSEDRSTMVLKEIEWKDVDWINLVQNRDSFEHSNEL